MSIFLKSDINIKQKVIDSILEYNSNLLNHQYCRGSENANNEIYQKSCETGELKIKILLTKTKIETVIEITPMLLLGSKMISVIKKKIKTKYEVTKLLRKIL